LNGEAIGFARNVILRASHIAHKQGAPLLGVIRHQATYNSTGYVSYRIIRLS